MQVIYATGRPGHLDFDLAHDRQSVPASAIIFAICMPQRTIENTDEDLFDAITDQEYFTVKAMIYEAMQREAARQPARLTLELSVGRFLRWLTDFDESKGQALAHKHRIVTPGT